MSLQTSILDDMKTKQHVQRMTDNRWPKQILVWMTPGRKKKGSLTEENPGCNAETGVEEGQWMMDKEE
jgi:hypothetical protein